MKNLLTPVYATLGPFGEISQNYYQGEYKYQLSFWACEYTVDKCREDSLNALRSWKSVSNPDENNPYVSTSTSSIQSFTFFTSEKDNTDLNNHINECNLDNDGQNSGDKLKNASAERASEKADFQNAKINKLKNSKKQTQQNKNETNTKMQ